MNSNKSIIANFETWHSPIGIPVPSFGIFETHYMYKNKTYEFHSGSDSYKDAGNGPYTHYIDNTHPAATDTDNPYGTSDTPRLSFSSLSTINSGAVVEIHGGPYSGMPDLIINGTSVQPIFIRGASMQEIPQFDGERVNVRGHYIIVENINFITKSRYSVRVIPMEDNEETHHVSIRNCEATGTMISNGSSLITTEDIVFYNNHIHPDNMLPPSGGDYDKTGIHMGGKTNRVWILDNHIHHTSGDCVGGGHDAKYSITNYYIGRNILHDASENAIDIKEIDTVIISENTMYNYGRWDKGSAAGVAIVIHYGPELSAKNVWVLFNEIYNANSVGIYMGSGLDYDMYAIGNIVHDIRNGVVAPYWFEHYDQNELIVPGLIEHGYINEYGMIDPNFTGLGDDFKSLFLPDYDQFIYIEEVLNGTRSSPKSGRAYAGRSTENEFIINNTFYDVDNGIWTQSSSGSPSICNNIISNISENGFHVKIEWSPQRDASEISHNIFYQPGGKSRIDWDEPIEGMTEFQAHTDKCKGCLEIDPLFVEQKDINFKLQEDSPAINAGTEHSIFQLYETMFGSCLSGNCA